MQVPAVFETVIVRLGLKMVVPTPALASAEIFHRDLVVVSVTVSDAVPSVIVTMGATPTGWDRRGRCLDVSNVRSIPHLEIDEAISRGRGLICSRESRAQTLACGR